MDKKAILFFLILILLIIPSGGLAQATATLSLVKVDLWPEFDRPSMLVIYHMALSPQAKLPQQISLRIPTRAGAPNAVAVKQPDGALISVPYEQEAEGTWSRLVFQATTPEIQVEYYDPELLKSNDQRHFEYTWPGDYAVDSFDIVIQQPIGGSEMQFKPGMATARQGDDGLRYYWMDIGSLPLGQEFKINVDYKKSTDELSASSIPVEPSAPLDDPNSGIASMSSFLPWAFGAVGVLLIVGGGLWYWQSGRQIVRPQRQQRQRRQPEDILASDEAEANHVYCHQCGKRAAPGDRFCRTCGTELRLG